jgi:hypothetical protein
LLKKIFKSVLEDILHAMEGEKQSKRSKFWEKEVGDAERLGSKLVNVVSRFGVRLALVKLKKLMITNPFYLGLCATTNAQRDTRAAYGG